VSVQSDVCFQVIPGGKPTWLVLHGVRKTGNHGRGSNFVHYPQAWRRAAAAFLLPLQSQSFCGRDDSQTRSGRGRRRVGNRGRLIPRDCRFSKLESRFFRVAKPPLRCRSLRQFVNHSHRVIFGLPSALITSLALRDIVLQTIGKQNRRGRQGQVEGPDPTGSAMMTKKQKAKDKKPQPAQSRSPIRSAVIGTVFNMVATAATFGSVLLCLVVAKHFT